MVNARNFRKHPELFRDKKSSCKICDTPSSIRFFNTRNFLKHQRVPPTNFPGAVGQKFLLRYLLDVLLKFSRPADELWAVLGLLVF